MSRISLGDPRLYLNRPLQWLAFNHRVLEEARDPGNPLLERVKFLAITANNLDEFVEIRVSGFLQKIEHGLQTVSPSGHTPAEELELVTKAIQVLERGVAPGPGQAPDPGAFRGPAQPESGAGREVILRHARLSDAYAR